MKHREPNGKSKLAGLLYRLSLIASAVLLAAASARGETKRAYKLLEIDGQNVKWGSSVPGRGARVTYAFVRHPTVMPNARNCRRMESVSPMLERRGLSFSELEVAFSSAAREWERAAAIHLTQIDDAGTADILIGAQTEPRGWAYANVSSERTQGKVAPIRKAAICFNPLRPWKIGFDGDLNTYDLRYVATHELGHAIGLDHPGPSGQLMSYRYEERFLGLRLGDAAGAAALYGPATPAGNDRLADAEQGMDARNAVSADTSDTDLAPRVSGDEAAIVP